jgi:hypothetical protein
MKNFVTIVFLCLIFFFQAHAQQTPELNQKIVDYVKNQIGKKVDYGECWDLAYEALTQNNCEWDGKYIFGKKLNQKTDSIYPGDIIQFYSVTLKYTKDRQIYKETYLKHTAIVYLIKEKGIFEIAHQNNGFTGRKVGISDLNMNNKISGTIEFFRPVTKTIR